MKHIIALSTLFLMSSSFAHDILGTQVLKGSLKTQTVVGGQTATCKVDVDRVKNLMEEDAYGNPAYKLQVEVKLEARAANDTTKTLTKGNFTMNNLFADGVRDFDYKSVEGATLRVNEQGRLVNVTFPFAGQTVRCAF